MLLAAEDCWTCCVHGAVSTGANVNTPPVPVRSSAVEAYCRKPWAFWFDPVLPNCRGVTHWLELLPVLCAENVNATSPLSFSFAFSFVTWAMAGTASASTKATIAANIIIFFNSYLLDY